MMLNPIPQIRLDVPREPCDLASRIMRGVEKAFAGHGLSLSKEHSFGLEQIALAVQIMADGGASLPLKFLLSALPTGAGKTTVMIEAVRAIIADPVYAHVGVVIFVNQLEQIETLIKEMGLADEQFVVRTGKKNRELNALGLTSLMTTEKDKKIAHRQAQVLFTTQQKFFHIAKHQKNFVNSAFFKFGDTIRQVRIWDEALLPAEPLVLRLDDIQEYIRRLKGWDETQAAAMLDEWVKFLKDLPSGSITEVPYFPLVMSWPNDDDDDDAEADLQTKGGALYQSELAQKMYAFAGHAVRVHQDNYSGTTALSYRESLPKEFAPLLILDASGPLGQLYQTWGEGRGDLVELPTVKKTYRNLTTHYCDLGAGKNKHRVAETREKLATVAADAIAQVPEGECVLIIHRLPEKPHQDLAELIRAKVRARGGDVRRLRFLTYGRHRATNEFHNVKHVIVLGLLQYGDPDYEAMYRAAARMPVNVPALRDEVQKTRLGAIRENLFQAVGRGAIRNMIAGDCPLGCHLWIVFSSWGQGMGGVSSVILKETFPETNVCAWQPIPTTKLRHGAVAVIKAVETSLGDKSELRLGLKDLGERSGRSWNTVQHQLRRPEVLRELCRRGIAVDGPDLISPKGAVVLRRGCQPEKYAPVLTGKEGLVTSTSRKRKVLDVEIRREPG